MIVTTNSKILDNNLSPQLAGVPDNNGPSSPVNMEYGTLVLQC